MRVIYISSIQGHVYADNRGRSSGLGAKLTCMPCNAETCTEMHQSYNKDTTSSPQSPALASVLRSGCPLWLTEDAIAVAPPSTDQPTMPSPLSSHKTAHTVSLHFIIHLFCLREPPAFVASGRQIGKTKGWLSRLGLCCRCCACQLRG